VSGPVSSASGLDGAYDEAKNPVKMGTRRWAARRGAGGSASRDRRVAHAAANGERASIAMGAFVSQACAWLAAESLSSTLAAMHLRVLGRSQVCT